MPAVVPPNLGLYLGSSPLVVPARALQDGRNFRIKQGKLSNLNLGWAPFFDFRNTSNTKVFLTFDQQADASVVFKDYAKGKSANRNWTANGNAQVDTGSFALGTGSLQLDGTGDSIDHPDHADFSLGSGACGIGIFFNCAQATGTAGILASQSDGSTAATSAWHLYRHEATDTIVFAVSNGSSFAFAVGTTPFTNLLNTGWHYAQVNREGGFFVLRIDGVQEGAVAFSGAVNNSALDLVLGALSDGTSAPFQGRLDHFTIDVGVVPSTTVPTSNFIGAMNGPVNLIDTFFIRGQTEVQIFGTPTDLYRLDETLDELFFISPTYTTGTVAVSGTAVTGTGTLWDDVDIKPGDQISFRAPVPDTHPFSQWYTIAEVTSNTAIVLDTAVIEGGGTIGAGAVYTIRRTFTGALRDVWDTEVFVQPDDGTGDDLMFFTQGVNPICKWDGQTASAIQTLTTIRARRLATWKNMMLYGWIVTGGDTLPTSFINSDIGKPEDIVNGLAGQFRIHDGVDHLIEMEDLGDNMVFYSERHTTLAQFVGDPLVFVFRQASTGIGPFAPRLISDFGDYHEFIGADTQYLFDGVAVTEVGKQVWREILRLRDPSRHFNGFAHFDEENGDLIWVVALTSDVGVGDTEEEADEAFVEHYLEEVGERVPDPVSRRAMPFHSGGYAVTRDTVTWNELTEAWEEMAIKWNESFLFSAFPINLMGADDGQVFIINVSQFANGVGLPSNARFGRRPLGDGRVRGLLTRVYPFMTQFPANSVTVTTRYTDHAGGPITITHDDTFDQALPEGGHFVTPYRRGRYFELEFKQSEGLPWECEGYDIDVKSGGRR